MYIKTMTLDTVLSGRPWYQEERVRRLARGREAFSAMEILELEELSIAEKFRIVLREELIEFSVLAEFVCRCAEEALKLVKDPDPRSLAAIAAKRAWINGEIDDEQLEAVRRDAFEAWTTTFHVAEDVHYTAYVAAETTFYAVDEIRATAARAIATARAIPNNPTTGITHAASLDAAIAAACAIVEIDQMQILYELLKEA